jgi:hypothetical protein
LVSIFHILIYSNTSPSIIAKVIKTPLRLAGVLGIEPSLLDLESNVLP